MVRSFPSSSAHFASVATALLLAASMGCKKDAPPATPAPPAPVGSAPAAPGSPAAPAPTPATLHPAQGSPGPFQVTTRQASYQTGDRQGVSVRTPESGWLYVGAINADGGVYLYYPNPSMPSGKVFKDRTINLPPESGLRPDEVWEINTTLPDGADKGREIAFAILTHQPLTDLKIEWGVDQRDALTKAGILAEGAKPTTPGAQCFPPSDKYKVAWREYDITRAPVHAEKPAP